MGKHHTHSRHAHTTLTRTPQPHPTTIALEHNFRRAITVDKQPVASLKQGSDIGDVVSFIKEYRRSHGHIVGSHVPRPGGGSGQASSGASGHTGAAPPSHGLARQSSVHATTKTALKSGFLCVRSSAKNLFGRWYVNQFSCVIFHRESATSVYADGRSRGDVIAF